MQNRSSSRTPSYDVIVIGAGGIGAATAYHLALNGQRVLLLEQYQIGNNRGSSHGESRIIRYAHDDITIARLMPQTFELWRQLEKDSDTLLLKDTGCLFIGPANSGYLQQCQAVLDAASFSCQHLTNTELAAAYPQFRVPTDWTGLFQQDGGILAAARCVQTLVAQAVEHGAQLHENAHVKAVSPRAGVVDVQVAYPSRQDTYQAEQVIIAAGPWAPHFLRALIPVAIPLRVTHQQVAYFAVERPDDFSPDRFPVFIIDQEPNCYGFPIWEQAGAVKIALEQSEKTIDPESERLIDQELLQKLTEQVKRYLPGVIPEVISADTCLYTETANRDFIVDRHPDYPQILFAAGFSGRGFKHTIAIGKLLADLTNTPAGVYDSPFWLDSYSIKRFYS